MNPKIIDRIRKILARTTERGATEAEAAAAMQAAQRLMAEHGVSILDLESGGFDSIEWTHQPAWEVDGLGDPETRYVAPVVSQAFKVRLFDEYSRDGTIRTTTRIFGEPVNVEVACWAFRYLHGIFKDLWVAYRLATKCHARKRGAYYYGLALGLQSKLDAASKQESKTGGLPGTGLALAYEAKLNEAFTGSVAGLRNSKGVPKFSDRNVALAGKMAGSEINLSRPISECEIRAITKK